MATTLVLDLAIVTIEFVLIVMLGLVIYGLLTHPWRGDT